MSMYQYPYRNEILNKQLNDISSDMYNLQELYRVSVQGFGSI